MKKLLSIIFAICLIPSLLLGAELDEFLGTEIDDSSTILGVEGLGELLGVDVTAAAAAYNYCTACPDAGAGADQFCEDFEPGDADGLCDWTITEGGGADGEVTMNAACDDTPALGCTDILMTSCASFVKTSANSYAALAYLANTATTIYAQVYFKLISHSLADTNFVTFLAITNTSNSPAAQVGFLLSGTDLYLQRRYYDTTDRVDTGGTIIALGTWYGIRLLVVDAGAGADSVQWLADYNLDGTFTDEGTASGLTLGRATDRFRIGASAGTRIYNFQLTGVKMDDDTTPGDCTR